LNYLFNRRDAYGFFLQPVDVSLVPDYTTVIKEPMDFGNIFGNMTTLSFFFYDYGIGLSILNNTVMMLNTISMYIYLGTMQQKIDNKVYRNLSEFEVRKNKMREQDRFSIFLLYISINNCITLFAIIFFRFPMHTVQSDFWLVIQNAKTYNTPDTIYWKTADRIGKHAQKLFDRESHNILLEENTPSVNIDIESVEKQETDESIYFKSSVLPVKTEDSGKIDANTLYCYNNNYDPF